MTPEDQKYWLNNQGEPRADALAQIASLLSSMFVSARAHVRGDDQEVVGYTVQTGALHKIVGVLQGLGHRVVIPANPPTANETISGVLLSTSKADERGSAEPVAVRVSNETPEQRAEPQGLKRKAYAPYDPGNTLRVVDNALVDGWNDAVDALAARASAGKETP